MMETFKLKMEHSNRLGCRNLIQLICELQRERARKEIQYEAP